MRVLCHVVLIRPALELPSKYIVFAAPDIGKEPGLYILRKYSRSSGFVEKAVGLMGFMNLYFHSVAMLDLYEEGMYL